MDAFFAAEIMILTVVMDGHRWVSRPTLASHVLPHQLKPPFDPFLKSLLVKARRIFILEKFYI